MTLSQVADLQPADLQPADLQPTLRRSDGSTAVVEDDCIVVRDARGRALLSFGEQGVRLIATDGDLTLSAPNGRVIVDAAQDVEVRSGGRVAVQSADADLRASRISVAAEQFTSRCTEVAHHVGRWEIKAQRIAETAVDVYRTVDGLVQTRAGRMRQIIDGASQLIAKRASISCDEEVSVDGSRVLLG